MKLIKLQVCKILLLCCMLILPVLALANGSDSFRIERLVTFLTLGTGSMTGTYFPLGNAFANVWTTHSDNVSVMSHSTRGSMDNLLLLKLHELNLAIAQSDMVLAAINGTGIFAGSAIADLRVMMALYPEVVQVVVPADSDIQNLAMMRGRKVVVGAPGSGNAMTSLELLAAFGITQADFQAIFISYDDVIQAMERRECDAAIVIAGIPTRTISELQKRMKLRILSFSQLEIASLTATLPYLAPQSIASDTYQGTENADTVALMAMLVCDAKLSEDLVFRLCRGIYDHLEYLQKIHERARDISLENFMKGVPSGAIHPGAARFFNERRQTQLR